MVQNLQTCRMHELWGHVSFLPDFRRRLGNPYSYPVRIVYKSVTVWPKVQGRPQEAGDTRNMEHLLRNVTDRQENYSNMGPWLLQPELLPKSFKTHILSQLVSSARCRTIRLVCLSNFQSFCGLIYLSHHNSLFQCGNVYLAIFCQKFLNLL